jgi:hypothetical protein
MDPVATSAPPPPSPAQQQAFSPDGSPAVPATPTPSAKPGGWSDGPTQIPDAPPETASTQAQNSRKEKAEMAEMWVSMFQDFHKTLRDRGGQVSNTDAEELRNLQNYAIDSSAALLEVNKDEQSKARAEVDRLVGSPHASQDEIDRAAAKLDAAGKAVARAEDMQRWAAGGIAEDAEYALDIVKRPLVKAQHDLEVARSGPHPDPAEVAYAAARVVELIDRSQPAYDNYEAALKTEESILDAVIQLEMITP